MDDVRWEKRDRKYTRANSLTWREWIIVIVIWLAASLLFQLF